MLVDNDGDDDDDDVDDDVERFGSFHVIRDRNCYVHLYSNLNVVCLNFQRKYFIFHKRKCL